MQSYYLLIILCTELFNLDTKFPFTQCQGNNQQYFRKTQAGKSRDYCDVIVYVKLCFQKCFLFTLKCKAAIFKFLWCETLLPGPFPQAREKALGTRLSGVMSVFENPHFCDEF